MVLVQDRLRLFQVTIIWHNDSSLSLNGLHHECNDVRIRGQRTA